MTGHDAANDYHFVTRWRVDARPEEVFEVIADGPSLSRWWPSVYLDVAVLEAGDEEGRGRVTSLRTKGFLPYTLPLVSSLFALWFWSRRGELPSSGV
jgi:Polyketide cyclase / dehydrase and lipid transport